MLSQQQQQQVITTKNADKEVATNREGSAQTAYLVQVNGLAHARLAIELLLPMTDWAASEQTLASRWRNEEGALLELRPTREQFEPGIVCGADNYCQQLCGSLAVVVVVEEKQPSRMWIPKDDHTQLAVKRFSRMPRPEESRRNSISATDRQCTARSRWTPAIQSSCLTMIRVRAQRATRLLFWIQLHYTSKAWKMNSRRMQTATSLLAGQDKHNSSAGIAFKVGLFVCVCWPTISTRSSVWGAKCRSSRNYLRLTEADNKPATHPR